MSNAAVIKLDDKSIAGDHVWLDDNFGESIHLHINDFRCDMTHEEFRALRDDTILALNNLIQVEGFDAGAFDPVFFEQYLWKRLSRLYKITYDEVFLRDLYEGGRHIKPLYKCKIYREMCGQNVKYKAKPGRKLNSMSEQERIRSVKSSIMDNGYDTDRGYILLYGDDNIVRDGRHRACAMLCTQGNIKVRVMRMYFKGDKPFNTRFRAMIGAPSFRVKDVIDTLKAKGYFSFKGIRRVMIKVYKELGSYKSRLSTLVIRSLHKKEQKSLDQILSNR